MIYVFLANGFEEVEALTPVDLLRRCEADVMTVGCGSQIIKGSHGIPVICDTDDNQFVLDETVDMIVLPGGMPGTLNLEKNTNVQKAIDFCIDNNKYIAAICAAPSILGHKGLLEGKKSVCFPGFEDQLKGADVLSEPVVKDGNIITARGAGVATEFGLKLTEVIFSEKRAQTLRNSLQCIK